MSELAKRLAKRLREQIPELGAGRVNAVFDEHLEKIIDDELKGQGHDTEPQRDTD